ncbi:MAG: hydrogenase/urease accessory protein HupE, partial [Oceanicoccus sp.]
HSQPLYIEISEQTSEAYQVQWRLPATSSANNVPAVKLPIFCQLVSHAGGSANALIRRDLYHCEQGLAGETVNVVYPRYYPATSSLIKFKLLNGQQHTRLLGPRESSWQIPLEETPSRIARDYTVLGFQHILIGIDHLLFVLCLLWIAGSVRRVLLTITGFTVAHSITLVLSAMDWVRVPVPAVEAMIALSIVFLATEIAKDQRHTLTWRYPVVVSSLFGLLHGFGFAAALADIGLPQTEVLTGLLFFNIGVELGQVLFALAVVSGMTLLKRFIEPWLQAYRLAQGAKVITSYGIGGVAAFWLVERCMAF